MHETEQEDEATTLVLGAHPELDERLGPLHQFRSQAGMFGFVFTIQIVLLLVAASTNLNAMNPDGIVYLRLAHYYAEGNFALAITGYWGPLLSWLMVPLIKLKVDPSVTARAAMLVSAVVFQIGAMRIYDVMLQRRTDFLLASLITVAFTIFWSIVVITPDLLMSGLLLVGISHTLSRDAAARRSDFWAGLFYGLAYFAKSVALPIAIALIIILHALRFLAGDRPARAGINAAIRTFLALMVTASPWILILSYHYGFPTFSTSALISYAIVGPSELASLHPFVRSFNAPDYGRVTSWEEPELGLYQLWSPFESAAAFKHQLRLIWQNLLEIIRTLRRYDLFGIGLSTTVLGFIFAQGRLRYEKWRFSAPAIAAMTGVYLLVFADDPRNYIGCYPLLLSASFGFVRDLSERFGCDSGRRAWSIQASTLATILVAGSFVVTIAPEMKIGLQGSTPPNPYDLAQHLAASLKGSPDAPLASVGPPNNIGFLTALYTAYLTSRAYYGNRLDDPSLEQLPSNRPLVLVLIPGTPLDKRLQEIRSAHILPLPSEASGGEEIRIYLLGTQ